MHVLRKHTAAILDYLAYLLFVCYSLGETCSHVAALLFKLEAAVRNGYTTTACTDERCRWNECFVDKVEAAPIAEIDMYSAEAKASLSKSSPEYTFSVSTPEEQKTFLDGLAALGEKVVGLCSYNEYNEPFRFPDPPPKPSLPRPLRDLYRPDLNEQERDVYLNDVLKGMSLTDEQVLLIEEQTRCQARSIAWHQQRAGRITASYAHDVNHCMLYNPPKSLIKRICVSNNRVEGTGCALGPQK